MSTIRELIIDENPSIQLNHRPFFSIIIPCYNSRKTLGALLASIDSQHMNDDIEVILSDDCSTESYQDIVDKFRDRLCIKQTKTEYNFAPGNTREQGLKCATGEWLAFADHDDTYIVDTLPQIKEYILESGNKYYAIANFFEVRASTQEVIRRHIHTRNWNHAKFYNKDNFWDANNIHFKKDLLTHEDIYISSFVNCACNKLNIEPLLINLFCYIWNARDTSLSRKEYDGRAFLEVHFRDYIASTGDLYIDKYKEGVIDFNFGSKSVIQVLLFCYFYTQGFKFTRKKDWLKINDEYCKEYLNRLKAAYNIDNKFILDLVSTNQAEMYIETRKVAYIATDYFIEDKSFSDWLKYLSF